MRRPVPRSAGPLAVLLVGGLLAGCGTPPEPLPTSPPRARSSESAGPSGMPFPSTGTLPPTGFLPTLPTGAVPPGGYPYPTYPTVRPTTPSPSPTRSLPPGAPACRNGPTEARLLALLVDNPGLPAGKRFEVRSGPYCSGSWHLALLGIVGETDKQAEELLMITTGSTTSPTLVAAGTDVCTDQVDKDAPVGIKVRASCF